MKRRWLALAFVLATMLGHERARADLDAKKACATTAEGAQQLRTEKKLRRARAQFIACAQESCPEAVRADCLQWLAEVDKSMPSVVIAVRNSSGADVRVKRVLADGEPLVDTLDGKAIAIDPGAHRFRAEREDGSFVELDVVVAEGEKSRAITLTMPDTVEKRASIPTASWILGGVSVVAFGSFAYFGLTGRAEASDRRTTCGPNCPQSDLDSIRRKLLIADISLGVGVVSFGVATVLVLTRPSKSTSAWIDVRPLDGGAFASIRSSF